MQDGIHLVGIYPCMERFGCSFEFQSQVLLFHIRLELAQEILDVLVQFAMLYMHTGGVQLFLLEIDQLSSQFGQSVRALDGRLQMIHALLRQLLGSADFVQWSLDEGERCTDVVCRMDEELNLLP